MNSKMRIVFLGTPSFAVTSLEKILNAGFNVVGVVTATDKPAGRGRTVVESEVKQFAKKEGLFVMQPTNLKDEGFINELKALRADLQIVVAFRMLPEVVWDMPKLGTYNLHASLLPKYRGAAPINWAVINGEVETGVSTFKLQHKIDTGNILLQKKVLINEEDNVGRLYEKLQVEGAKLLVETLKLIEKNSSEGTPLNFIEQDEKLVCEAPKLNKMNTKINWNNSALCIHNLVRGLSPYPCAHTTLINNGFSYQLKIFKTQINDSRYEGYTNGFITTNNKITLTIKCGEQSIDVLELQLEGKKRMLTKDFLLGFKLSPNAYVM
jgi:methionyl-tRNA formyltransferase